jgi:hypothetical protein
VNIITANTATDTVSAGKVVSDRWVSMAPRLSNPQRPKPPEELVAHDRIAIDFPQRNLEQALAVEALPGRSVESRGDSGQILVVIH